MDNFIEHKNFFRIYTNNFKYQKQHRRHNKALYFQLVLLVICIGFAYINKVLTGGTFVEGMYLDQINRIYAILVALLTAILIGLTPLDHSGKLSKQQYEYIKITYKQDYVSIVMYTLFLFVAGIATNILYAMLLQYFNLYIIDVIFWIFHLFVLLNSLFFTLYCVDELADIVKNVS